jgi:hypothetical protein
MYSVIKLVLKYYISICQYLFDIVILYRYEKDKVDKKFS